MHKKAAICVLTVAAGVLVLSVSMLFFGDSGFINANRKSISEISSSRADDARLDENEDNAEEQTDSDSSEEHMINSQQEIQTAENMGSSLVFSMGSDADEARILPQEVIDATEAVDKGENLDTATGMKELAGYSALTVTHVIIAKDKETEEESTGSGRLTLYVPNLIEGLKDVSVLFYDCAEEQWRVIPADRVDVANKRVSVMINGSGVATTVHRLE